MESPADTPFWRRRYRLDKMSLSDLWRAFFLHHTVQGYLVILAGALWLAVREVESPWRSFAAAAVVLPIYPLAWYLLHRFVLHGQYLYRSRYTAKVWKRIHFDHHRDPHDLDVLFGALYTTLPTLLLIGAPVGWWIGGLGGAAAAFASAIVITLFYEFNHCIQHLKYTPNWPFVARIKKLHLQHHFHNENVNFGITNYALDRWLGTFNPDARDVSRSETVFNLGYTGEKVRDYPWVVRMTHDLDEETAIRDGVSRRIPERRRNAADAPAPRSASTPLHG